MKQMLMVASVPSMIGQFNMGNINILQSMGYEVHVACNFKDNSSWSKDRVKDFVKQLEKLNIKKFQIDFSRDVKNLKKHLKSYKQLKEVVIKENYAFIHCHTPIGGVIGRMVAHKLKTKVIYTAHGFHFFKGAPIRNWLIYYPIEKCLARYTDMLITINSEDYRLAEKRFPIKDIRLVNGVGVDLDKFKNQTNELKLSTRKKYGYNNEDFILIHVAELNYNKNQDLLIDVINVLKEKIPNIKLLLVGKGACENYYKKKVEKYKLTSYIKFLGYRTDVNNLLMLSDVAVSASRREGLPVSILESMAVGLPLVVTDCRGNRDLVLNGKNGFIVEMDSVEKFSEKIIILYENIMLRKNIMLVNRLLIQNYSIKKVKRLMKKNYIEQN